MFQMGRRKNNKQNNSKQNKKEKENLRLFAQLAPPPQRLKERISVAAPKVHNQERAAPKIYYMRRQFSAPSPATISKELSRVPAIFVDDEDYHYRELDFLGAVGGFGEVTKVLEEETGDIYALKTMSTKKLKTFENEDAMLQQVGEREDIVELIRAFIYKDRSCMVFGYCPWGDLEAFLRMRKILTEEEAIFFTTQIVGAVAAIHKAKVIHRDLKPSNIFLVDGMRIKVGDFGVTTTFGERKKEIVGTPGYYAPEVLLGQIHTAAIDVWCVGTMIYQMLAGKLPAHTTKNWVCYNPRFLDKVTMSRSTQKLIRRMLNMSLEARPKTRDLLTWPILNSNALPNSLSVVNFLVAHGDTVDAHQAPVIHPTVVEIEVPVAAPGPYKHQISSASEKNDPKKHKADAKGLTLWEQAEYSTLHTSNNRND